MGYYERKYESDQTVSLWLSSFFYNFLIRFEFVKSSGSHIVPVQVPRGQERNARVIRHISGQGPLYIRALEVMSSKEVIA